MPLTVARCDYCGSSYYEFEPGEWDQEITLAWCPGCRPEGRHPKYPVIVFKSRVAGWRVFTP